MVKLRLLRKGRNKSPFYWIVAADSRYPRDGRFIDKIGYYNPMIKTDRCVLDAEKAKDWMSKGAQPTDRVHRLLSLQGVVEPKKYHAKSQ